MANQFGWRVSIEPRFSSMDYRDRGICARAMVNRESDRLTFFPDGGVCYSDVADVVILNVPDQGVGVPFVEVYRQHVPSFPDDGRHDQGMRQARQQITIGEPHLDGAVSLPKELKGLQTPEHVAHQQVLIVPRGQEREWAGLLAQVPEVRIERSLEVSLLEIDHRCPW
jgi:hypothetical protein